MIDVVCWVCSGGVGVVVRVLVWVQMWWFGVRLCWGDSSWAERVLPGNGFVSLHVTIKCITLYP